MSIALIFPGQGSQAVGMGAELAKAYAPARAVFAEIDEALGQSLSTLIWVGPEDQLTLTENAQPALMAVSLATLRVLDQEATIQSRAVDAAQRSLTQATNRYNGGLATYLEVTSAQSVALANQRAAVDILTRRMTASVLLMKGLGGGWQSATLPQTPN